MNDLPALLKPYQSNVPSGLDQDVANAVRLGLLARPSTHTPRWVRASAWQPRWRTAVVPTCRRRNNPVSRPISQSPIRQRIGLCALRARTTAAEYCVFAQYSCRLHPSPSSTTRATPSARCCTKPWPITLRPGLIWPAPASSKGKATTTAPSPMCAKRSRNIWSAASTRTALPAPAATTADTTFWWPSPAKAGACAPHAPGGAWPRRRHTSATTSSPACPSASGCCRFPSGCGTSCSAMARCWAWCCASSYASSRKPCKPTALVRPMWKRQHCTSAQSPSSTASAPA